MAEYLQLKLKGEVFASYPANVRFSPALLRHYPCRGGKVVRALIFGLQHASLDGLLLRRTSTPLRDYGLDSSFIEAWVAQQVGPGLRLCYFFPSALRSANRVYAYAVRPVDSTICAYVKIVKTAQEIDALHREIQASETLQRQGVKLFRFAKCGASAFFGEEWALAQFDPLPMDCVPRHFELGSWERLLAPCQAEFSAGTHQVLDEAALEGEHWMKALRQSPPSRFQTVALEALRDGVNVCRTHGDLARQNIRFSGDTPWIIDWEEMTEQGPCLTDKICFELCVWYYELGWPLDKVFNEFMSRYLCGPTRREAIHALAFLFALRGSMGELMVSFWNDHASEVATILRKGNLK